MNNGVLSRAGSSILVGLTAAGMIGGAVAGVVLMFAGFTALLFWVGVSDWLDVELTVILAMFLTLLAFVGISWGVLHFWEE